MGFFDKETPIEKLVKELGYTDYEYKNLLSSFDFSPYIHLFKDEELLSDVLRQFARKNVDFSIHMDFVANMFSTICVGESLTKEKQLFKSFFNLYMEKPENQELFLINDSFQKIIRAFDDKKIALEYLRFLTNDENILENSSLENLSLLIDYAAEARRYYVDDRAHLSSAVSLIKNFDPVLLKYGDKEQVKQIIDKRLSEDKRMSGLYDVDMATLAELSAKVDEIFANGNGLETLIKMSEKEREILKKELTAFKQGIAAAKDKEIAELQRKASQILKEFTATHLELQEQQRTTVIAEKDSLLQDVNNELEKKKAELFAIADSVGKRISTELVRVHNTTNDSVKRIKEFVDNNEEIKKLIAESKSNDELVTALTQFVQYTHQAGLSIPISPDQVKIPTSSEVFVTPGVAAVNGITVMNGPERELDPRVNYYFDETIPFKDRFRQLIELKEKDERENGTIYHEKFDTIAKFIMIGETPYMIGPSGCGKTFMIEDQIARLFGLNVVADSYITIEQTILGYTNGGNGSYVPSNFYRCYKYGDIYLLDEIDNSIANAAIILNKFMGNSNQSFTFPDGITINRHPNFRIIAAGNTKGYGSTQEHNTRQKLDEATLQRMTPVEVDYDNRIEMRILKDYPAWYDFAVNFRAAVESTSQTSYDEVNTIGTFTTRDATSIKKCLDTGVFTDEELMLYKIVETKDDDTLGQISLAMQNNGNFKNNGSRQLFNLFNSVIEAKKTRGKVKCKTM